ncbi:hypothetical protein DRO30_01345 [Candidatus Bathyarchaeota archaeon]|nr:MAG: hypothetical protein DRO30_01345 [Candidatus Bathyarchaeota archaeon]
MKIIIDWKKDNVNVLKKRGRHEIIFCVPAYIVFHPGLKKGALIKCARETAQRYVNKEIAYKASVRIRII